MKTTKLSPPALARRMAQKALLRRQAAALSPIKTFAWQPEAEKPEPYRAVLLALTGGDFTTGHWASEVPCWIGHAFNQSPPTYRLDEGSVIQWAVIGLPEELIP
jgi:hypothetical protein